MTTKYFSQNWLVFFILCIALVLRLIAVTQSLWLDEAINVLAAKEQSFFHFISVYPIGDFHPPLYFAFLWVWERLFGISEFAVRSLSIILGVATVFLTYLIGKKIGNEKIALIAALLLSFSPLHVYYSQEARMYSLATFSVALCFYFFVNLLESPKYFFAYVFSVILVLYSDYTDYLILPAQLISLVFIHKRLLKRILLAQVIGGVSLVFLLPFFFNQLKNGLQTAALVPGWKEVVGGNSLKDLGLTLIKPILGRISFDNKLLYTFIVGVLGIFYGAILAKAFTKKNNWTVMLSFWVIFPVLVAFIISYFIPILSYFRLLYILPGFYLLVALGIANLGKRFIIPVVFILLLISFMFLFIYYTNPKFQRENWKGLAQFYAKQSNSLLLFEDNNPPEPYRYYDTSPNAQGALQKFPASYRSDVKNINELVKGKEKIFLLNYFVDIADPNHLVEQKMDQLGYRKVKTIDFVSLGFLYQYEK